MSIGDIFRKVFKTQMVKRSSSAMSMNDFLRLTSSIDGGSVSYVRAFDLYLRNSIVHSSVDLVCESLSDIEIIMEDTNGNIVDSDIIGILSGENGIYNRNLLYLLGRDLLLSGIAAIVLRGDSLFSKPEVVEFLPSSNISFLTDGYGRITSIEVIDSGFASKTYNFMIDNDGKARFVNQDLSQVIIFGLYEKNFTPGVSPLTAISSEIEKLKSIDTHTKNQLKNGGFSNVFVGVRGNYTSDDFDNLCERLYENFIRNREIGFPNIINTSDMDVKNYSLSNKEIQADEIQKDSERKIARFFNVPLPLISTETQTFSNFQEAKLSLYNDAIFPLFKKISSGFKGFLFKMYGVEEGNNLTFNPLKIQTIFKSRVSTVVELVNSGALTRNEVRALLGYNRIDGGDEIYEDVGKIPIGTDTATNAQE